MKKAFRVILISLGSLILVSVALFFWMKHQTKQASPEQTVSYSMPDDGTISINYSRPSKKGRVIFGELVPYGVTWRTGANEPTTFDTDKDLMINGVKLPAGHYTLWTVPNPHEWEVIWNKKDYFWGIDGEKASRNPQYDVLNVKATPTSTVSIVDTFTIELRDRVLGFSWDQTRVEVLIEAAE